MTNLGNKRITPLAYYVKLYCRRKGNSNTKFYRILVEATKSYTSLSKTEKDEFLKKYEEYKKNNLKNIANSLQKVKPYLKKKQPKCDNKHASDEKHVESCSKEKETIAAEVESTQNKTMIETNIETINETNCEHQNDEVLDTRSNCGNVDSMSANEEQPIIQNYELPEPTPPSLITGEELFRMVHNRSEGDFVWSQLPQRHKWRYQTAVLTIKKKYLKDYQQYLESLPHAKLLNHYKKVIGSD